MSAPARLAVLGAGHVGPVIARLALKAGYPTAIATSGDPDALALITELLIPGAQPRWAADAVADADIVVLAIPLHRFLDIDPTPLRGKLVVDAMNYWPASDGALEVLADGASSELVADVQAARERIYAHSLQLEDARAQAAYGQHSYVGKILEIHQELPDRIHLVLIRKVVGF